MTTSDLDALRADVSDILSALEEQLQLMAEEGPQEAHSAAVLMRHYKISKTRRSNAARAWH